VTSCSEINGFISLGEIPVFISLENLWIIYIFQCRMVEIWNYFCNQCNCLHLPWIHFQQDVDVLYHVNYIMKRKIDMIFSCVNSQLRQNSVTSDFRYWECKWSYTFYYIDFTPLFAIIKRLKWNVFHCRLLNDIFDCDVGTFHVLTVS
jgi:hypothetical protein